MPEATPEELEARVRDEAIRKMTAERDRLANKEYKTDTEIAEIKAKFGVKTDEISAESLEQMTADIDEVKKAVADMAEQVKEAAGGKIPADDQVGDMLKEATFGQMFSEIRDARAFGKMGPIMDAMAEGDFSLKKLSSEGIPVPKPMLKQLYAAQRKTTGFLEEGQGSLGGFTVPEQFMPDVLSIPLQPPVMRGRAMTIPGTSNVLKIPHIQDESHASNVYGGVAGNWTAEGSAITKSNPSFAQTVLTAKKLALLTYASNELLDDNAVGLNSILVRLFSDALGWFEDAGFIGGSGVNEPMGLTNAAAALASGATTASTEFYIADACELLVKSIPGTESRLIWLMNPAVRKALPKMLTLGGATAGAPNIWYPGALSVKDSPEPWRLLGMPIFFTEHLAAFGTDKDILLIDPTYYVIMMRQEIRAAVSTDIRFEQDETGYRLTERTDGRPWPSSALTLADGSNQVSPIVYNNHT